MAGLRRLAIFFSSEEKQLLKTLLVTRNRWMNTRKWWVKNNHPISLFDKLQKLKETTIKENHSFVALTSIAIDGKHLCSKCGKETKYHSSYKKFATFCSASCANSSSITAKNKSLAQTSRSKESFQKSSVKRHKTCLKKYGSETYNNSKKAKETCLDKYGVDNGSKTVEAKNKISKALKGVPKPSISSKDHFTWNNYTDLAKEVLGDKNKLHYEVVTLNKPYHVIADELGCSTSVVGNYCFKYDIEPNRYSSWAEEEIYIFLVSIGITNIVRNTRNVLPSRKELDIYLPDHNIAIEYDGVFWHSTGDIDSVKKVRNKHLEKTKECESMGIDLLHVFENEWIDGKREIWESVIKAKLGVLENRVFARKTVVKEISKKEAAEFCRANHLQGSAGCSVAYGLYYNNLLVSCMTFGKARYSKDEIELIRFCSLLNTSVVGGFSKLLSHSSIKEVISFANRRWSSAKTYKNNGFETVSISAPNYFYVNKASELESRLKYQKHKLSSVLKSFNTNMSERENMLSNGFRIIFDCGNIKMVYTC